MPLKVCIGITTHNRAEILRKAIQSALEQDYSEKEVFVFDDGSTDGTAHIRSEFPMVRWHREEKSRGLRDARNFMMLQTAADLFCSLDDDSWFVNRDGLTLGVKQFESQEKLGALGFEILDQGTPEGHGELRVRPTNLFVGCGHLLRLSAVKDVGYYHRLPGEYGGEEKDLCIRLMDAGYEVLELQGVHVWHDKTFRTRDIARQHYSGVLNDLALTLHRAPLFFVPLAIPAKIVSHLKFAIRYCFRDTESLSDFDRRIRNDYGRTALIIPTISGVLTFLKLSLGILFLREPVRSSTFRTILDRGRQ